MSDYKKPQSPGKPRGKNLEYAIWCDKKVEHSQKLRWIKVLDGVKFDHQKGLYDTDTQDSMIQVIC